MCSAATISDGLHPASLTLPHVQGARLESGEASLGALPAAIFIACTRQFPVLVIGKPLGIFSAAWIAVRLRIATKPPEYSWRQLCGAGALAGIGFTMSLFIAGEAFPNPADFAAAKIAIFSAYSDCRGHGSCHADAETS